eukprot:CAMPEP_0172492876 /NCGR_PEP_ID=MMETSP1066-20121228/24135_1 /TAXON_ID=671091 /ORGANISM="Coscinodiscus wailesii, Strain CCMP2513" /LENGTH=610 /DNA_ID=CAMNT_0013262729 /DNA_START=30 /DNA_END=1862 /DNA_ORIENTATION=+
MVGTRKDIVDQQLDDLRERMRLLQQDRRANVDILEANKVAIAEEVRNLRDENKDLRLQLTKLKKLPNGSGGGCGNDNAGTAGGGGNGELATLQKEVLRLRSEYDGLKVRSAKLKGQLDKLKDEAKLCELEARRPNQEDSPLSRKIRMLENRLDKAMIKYNEAQSIRNTYEHISKRLKEERLSFDNQLTALDRTLRSKQRDYRELLLLSGNANHAREVAQHELQRAQQTYEEKRVKRENEIRERHQVVKVRKQMIERQERREYNRKKQLQLQQQQQQWEGSFSGGTASSSSLAPHENDENDDNDDGENIDVYETAFRKIKEATGVSDVNDVINKILGQGSTTENLLAQTKHNQARIEELLTTRDALKKTVEEEKYTGGGGGGTCCLGRKAVDEKEELLARSTSRLERTKNKYDRFASILISVTAGVNHLKDILETVREDVGVEKTTAASSESSSVVPNALKNAGVILIRLQSQIDDDDETTDGDATTTPKKKGDNSAQEEDRYNNDEDDDDDEEESVRRPYNRRIRLPSARDSRVFERDGLLMDDGMMIGDDKDGRDGDDEDDDDGFEELDGGEAELSRERVKKASSEIVMAQERRRMKQQQQQQQQQQGR